MNDDLYALGLCFWELYTGVAPFADIYHDDIIEELKQRRMVDVDISVWDLGEVFAPL